MLQLRFSCSMTFDSDSYAACCKGMSHVFNVEQLTPPLALLCWFWLYIASFLHSIVLCQVLLNVFQATIKTAQIHC